MANNKLELFSYYRSSSAWRIRTVLAFKGLEYDLRAVNLLKGEQLGEEFLAINPRGQVPVLQVDGNTITQSVSIFEYLEEAYPEKPLLPKDIFERAKVREIAELVVSGIQPIQNLSTLKRLPEDQRQQWARDTIARGFEGVEGLLTKSSGKYCVGDTVTWADCCLVPQIYNANRFGVDMTSFPNITRVEAALNALQPFQDSHPDQQPDFPKEV